MNSFKTKYSDPLTRLCQLFILLPIVLFLATESLQAQTTLDFTESFDDPAHPGETVTLEFTIDAESDGPITGLAFSDDLDAVLSGLAATDLPKNDVCGTGSLLSGTSILSLSGGNLPANGSCTFDVTLQVPEGVPFGDYINTTSELYATGLSIADPASDVLTVAKRPFITTCKTDNNGSSEDNQISIPITGTGYDFTVNWGDGLTTEWEDGDDMNALTHTDTSLPWQSPEITTLSISRNTEQQPIDPPDPGVQS